jgi:hypothetical protein
MVLRFDGKINYNFMGTHIFKVVTDCLKCCCGTKVWCQDRLYGVITDCL